MNLWRYTSNVITKRGAWPYRSSYDISFPGTFSTLFSWNNFDREGRSNLKPLFSNLHRVQVTLGNEYAWNEHNVHTVCCDWRNMRPQKGKTGRKITQAYLPHLLPPSQWNQFAQIAVSVWFHIFPRLLHLKFICLSFPDSRMGLSSETQHRTFHSCSNWLMLKLCIRTHKMLAACLTVNRKTKQNRLPIWHLPSWQFSHLLLWRF